MSKFRFNFVISVPWIFDWISFLNIQTLWIFNIHNMNYLNTRFCGSRIQEKYNFICENNNLRNTNCIHPGSQKYVLGIVKIQFKSILLVQYLKKTWQTTNTPRHFTLHLSNWILEFRFCCWVIDFSWKQFWVIQLIWILYRIWRSGIRKNSYWLGIFYSKKNICKSSIMWLCFFNHHSTGVTLQKNLEFFKDSRNHKTVYMIGNFKFYLIFFILKVITCIISVRYMHTSLMCTKTFWILNTSVIRTNIPSLRGTITSHFRDGSTPT